MPEAQSRYLILTAVLAGACVLLSWVAVPQPAGAARWPTDDAVYAVDGWVMGPISTETPVPGLRVVRRDYQRADGLHATFFLWTAQQAKHLYQTSPELPFQGSGFTAEAVPDGLILPSPHHGERLLHGQDHDWLLLYAYGERRGLLGNGLGSWALAALDTAVGQPNNYFVARLMVRLDGLDSDNARAAAALADDLFPRLPAWYRN